MHKLGVSSLGRIASRGDISSRTQIAPRATSPTPRLWVYEDFGGMYCYNRRARIGLNEVGSAWCLIRYIPFNCVKDYGAWSEVYILIKDYIP